MGRLSIIARSFVLALGLCVAGGVAGCGSGSTGDPELTVYLSAPLSGPRADDGRDVAAAAKLALKDAGGEAGGTAVRLVVSDDADGGGWDAGATASNARAATEDSTSIAFIGDLDSGASRTSIPITNQAGLLQVSPGSGAEDLARSSPGSSDLPDLQSTGSRTFGRVIPSDRAQGEAAGTWMAQMGIASVELSGPDSDFADALRAGLEAASPGPAIVDPGDRAEALFDVSAEYRRPQAEDSIKRPTFFSDALLDPGPVSVSALLDPGPVSVSGPPCLPGECSGSPLVVSAALDPSQLPPLEAESFLSDIRAASGRAPGRYAAYGYEATAVVLDSIDRADDPLDRSAVIDAFFATRDRDSILGTYSIDGVGNTTLDSLGAFVGSNLPVRVRPAPRSIEIP